MNRSTAGIIPLILLVVPVGVFAQGGPCPDGPGEDEFPSTVAIVFDLDVPPLGPGIVVASGPITVSRGSSDGGDPCVIETEIIAMSLTGTFDAVPGPKNVTITLDPEPSTGTMTSSPGPAFPVISCFDTVYVSVVVEDAEAPVSLSVPDMCAILGDDNLWSGSPEPDDDTVYENPFGGYELHFPVPTPPGPGNKCPCELPNGAIVHTTPLLCQLMGGACLPIATEKESWGRVKSEYRE
jgi:hypothetical protein